MPLEIDVCLSWYIYIYIYIWAVFTRRMTVCDRCRLLPFQVSKRDKGSPLEVHLAFGLTGFAIGWALRDQSIPVQLPTPCHCRCECISTGLGVNPVIWILVLALLCLGVIIGLKSISNSSGLHTTSKGGKGVYGGVGKSLTLA